MTRHGRAALTLALVLWLLAGEQSAAPTAASETLPPTLAQRVRQCDAIVIGRLRGRSRRRGPMPGLGFGIIVAEESLKGPFRRGSRIPFRWRVDSSPFAEEAQPNPNPWVPGRRWNDQPPPGPRLWLLRRHTDGTYGVLRRDDVLPVAQKTRVAALAKQAPASGQSQRSARAAAPGRAAQPAQPGRPATARR